MQTPTNQTAEPKSQTVAETTPKSSKGGNAIQFKDNRPATAAQRIMTEVAANDNTPPAADNRPEAIAQRKKIDVMNSSPRSQPVFQLRQMPVGHAAPIPENPVQREASNGAELAAEVDDIEGEALQLQRTDRLIKKLNTSHQGTTQRKVKYVNEGPILLETVR